MNSSNISASAGSASSASFRDPSGFVFQRDGIIYRQVNHSYKADYDHLMVSGLYQGLVEAGLLVPHEEVSLALARTDEAYKVLKPEVIPFISYPYEWSFGMLKDAALMQLRIQRSALKHGMTLKDATAYNTQFYKGKAIFKDKKGKTEKATLPCKGRYVGRCLAVRLFLFGEKSASLQY